MPKFQLINPYLKGDIDRTFSGKSQHDAAQNAWDSLSSHFTNNVPKFAFTLESVGDHSLHHFVVRERTRDNTVNYTLEELSSPNQSILRKFTKKISQLKKNKTFSDSDSLAGGKRKKTKKSKRDDSSSSNDSDDELYNRMKTMVNNPYSSPILYWWYSPLVYNLDYVYIPTFTSPLSPYVEIDIRL
jgi:hypothetical protein